MQVIPPFTFRVPSFEPNLYPNFLFFLSYNSIFVKLQRVALVCIRNINLTVYYVIFYYHFCNAFHYNLVYYGDCKVVILTKTLYHRKFTTPFDGNMNIVLAKCLYCQQPIKQSPNFLLYMCVGCVV